MLVPLSEVLALPSFRAAVVSVAVGDPAGVQVRWVHSSEVYEMGSLLAGGELLLSTGLGLHGRSSAQLAAYVDALADAGCVALGLELGRSLFAVPAPMLETAARRGLVILTFGAVVPFERMAEDFHELLLQRKLGAAGSGEAVWRDLLTLVVAGAGLRALLDAVSRAAGCPVELHDTDGTLLERSRIPSAAGPSAVDTVAAEVRTATGPAGTLLLRGRRTRRRTAVAERAAVAVALELGRHPALGQRPSLAQAVVTDLAAGRLLSSGDVLRRCADAGWTVAPGQHVAAVAVEAPARTTAAELVPLVEPACSGAAGPVLAGAVGSEVVVLLRTPPVASRLRTLVTDAAARLGVPALVGVSAATADPCAWGAAIGTARGVVRNARRVGRTTGVVLSRDVGLERLLGEIDPTLVADLVAEQVGPLIEHDRAHSADLVRTLDAYLSAGHSKAETARLLGIRRQSLYARIERIERLLGVDLTDPAHVAGLAVALTAWRMRTGLDPQAAFERSPRVGAE